MIKVTVDEKKLDEFYRQYLMKLWENPGISENLKSVAPKDWIVSTSLISCVFAATLEDNFHDIVSISLDEVKFEKIKNEDKSNL